MARGNRTAALTLLLITLCTSCAAMGRMFTPEFWTRIWRILFGALAGIVFAVVFRIPVVGGAGAGAVGAGTSQALGGEGGTTNVTNINNKGGVINMKSGGAKFLGIDSFWWGVILSHLVPFLIRNRQHLADLVKGRRTGQVLATWAHMLWGRALPALRRLEELPPETREMA